MAAHGDDAKPNALERNVRDMKIEAEGQSNQDGQDTIEVASTDGPPPAERAAVSSATSTPQKALKKSASGSPVKKSSAPQSPVVKSEHEQTAGGEIRVKMESGQVPKLSRTSSKKVAPKPPTLYLDFPNKISEAFTSFEEIKDCIYANKYLGTTDHALECDCSEEWGKFARARPQLPLSTKH